MSRPQRAEAFEFVEQVGEVVEQVVDADVNLGLFVVQNHQPFSWKSRCLMKLGAVEDEIGSCLTIWWACICTRSWDC